jgi:hypothetical protein
MKQLTAFGKLAQEKLTQFRAKLYNSFAGAADASLDLLDALSSNEHAQSSVELSLTCFCETNGSLKFSPCTNAPSRWCKSSPIVAINSPF